MMDGRVKATPLTNPGIGPVSISIAYAELAQEEFAIWIRLHEANDNELSAGRGAIATLLQYSERRSNEVLRTLNLKGYIAFHPCPGKPTRISIIRRAIINARGNFVRLSDTFSNEQFVREEPGQGSVEFVHVEIDTIPVGVAFTQALSRIYSGLESHLLRPELDLLNGQAERDNSFGEQMGRKPFCGAMVQGVLNMANLTYQVDHDKQKFVDEGQYCDAIKSSPIPTKGIVASLKVQKDQLKEVRKAERSEAMANRTKAAKVQGRIPGAIDWMSLDKYEDPILTFDPSSRKHSLFLAILKKPKNDKARQSLEEKIETEFCRIYTRYRRDAERRRLSTSNYSVADGERKYAREAGIICLQKGVTPRRLLEFWDANIKTFAQKDMVLPPLSFLKSPANIDRVACSVFEEIATGAAMKHSVAADASRPKGGNSYASTGQLHPKLRQTLEHGGFSTQSYSDRYLLTIQHNAILVAEGKPVFMANGKPREMANYAAEVLYAND